MVVLGEVPIHFLVHLKIAESVANPKLVEIFGLLRKDHLYCLQLLRLVGWHRVEPPLGHHALLKQFLLLLVQYVFSLVVLLLKGLQLIERLQCV